MNKYILIILCLFLNSISYSQGPTVSYGINSNTPNQADIDLISTVEYNSAPFNLWNSLVFTVRYPSTFPMNLITSITNTSGVFAFSGQATINGGDGFFYKTFVNNNTGVQFDLDMNVSRNIAIINFATNTSGPALVELYIGSIPPAINNAIFDNVFSSFSPASTPVALPITLKSFDATKHSASSAKLDWTTSKEVNSDYFGIERSIDGSTWDEIARVKAAGDSNLDIAYDYIDDRLPLSRTNGQVFYYRLRMTDLDGAFKYSDVRGVNFDKQALGPISIYPNPTTEIVNIDLSEVVMEDGDVYVSVYDMSGRLVMTKQIIGSGIELIKVDQLPSDAYNFIIRQGEQIHQQRVIKID